MTTVESHTVRGSTHQIIDGVFHWEGLNFRVREGARGKCDVGIVMNCINRDGFSYWHLSEEPYTGVVIDVGAHIGGFTCAVARTARHVYAYEASTENYNLLVENVSINQLSNVTCFHRAAGNGMPQRILLYNSQSTSPSCFWISPGADTEEIPGVDLEGMIDTAGESIELMKIDCEGGEYDLFLGKPDRLVRSISMIASEIHSHPKYVHDDLIKFMVSCGYKANIHASRADTCKMGDFWRIPQ